MMLGGFWRVWGTFLDYFWAGAWDIYGTLFGVFGGVLGKALGRCLEASIPTRNLNKTNQTLLNLMTNHFFWGVVGFAALHILAFISHSCDFVSFTRYAGQVMQKRIRAYDNPI